jgi:geranylgeranyl pyrophosphate synthase
MQNQVASNFILNEGEFLKATLLEIQKTINLNSSNPLLDMATEIFATPGKMLRSKMIYNLGHILNVSESKLVAWAATIELLHNATLIHDDFQDGDELCRGQPTEWKMYGAPQAINLGDFESRFKFWHLS